MVQTPLQKFVETYQQLGKYNLHSLREVYHPDVEFIDNLHHLHGINQLIQYFEGQYSNLNSCSFDIRRANQTGDDAWLIWDMRFAHPRLRGGKLITVNGASHLRLTDSVTYHRDYFDMGATLYEHLPIIGSAITWIKQRAAR
ncbi:MAG: nuclear transport factor 2 family protein [Granulosicoccaceae bacterium]